MADHIQIGDITPRIRHNGDGATTIFTYPFPIFINADLEVYVDGVPKVLNSDYTMTGAGISDGGTVSFTASPTEGADILFLRRLIIARTSDFQASGEFRAKVINDELDFQTAVLQQINDDLGRTIRLQRTSAPATLELPDTATRAGRALAFDADGNITTTSLEEIGATAIISSVTPSTGSDSGSAGTSLQLSAADHSHPLPALSDIGIATQSEAETGVNNAAAMTPLRTAQAIATMFDGVDPVARDMASSALAIAMAANDASSIIGNVGKFWLSDDFDSDSLAVSTGASFDAAGGSYGNPGFSADLCTGGFASASSSYGGSPPGDAFNNNYAPGNYWVSNAASSAWLEYNFGTTYEIRRIGIQQFVPGDQDAASGNIDVQRYNGGAWTTVANLTPDINDGSMVYYDLPASAADARWRIKSNDTTSHYWKVTEVEMIEMSTPTNMILVPTSATLDAADPFDVIGYFVFAPVDSVTFGTDLVGKISIDDGATKATGAWTKVGDMATDGQELWRLEVDVSVQSGALLTYEITTLNNKQIELHDCVGLIATY